MSRPAWLAAARVLVPALALPVLLAACAATSPLPYPTVPPLLAERVPAPPRASVPLIWQPGHYDWDGARYTWVAGEWIERSRQGTLWQDGYWRRDGAAYAWIPAHWI